MARERIHKLAAEWGVKSKDIIERLEKMGVTGKKAQSVLEESIAERVRREMGFGVPEPEVGQERVTNEAVMEKRGPGQTDEVKVLRTVTETRVKTGVLLRRTKRREVVTDDGTGIWHVPGAGSGLRVATAVDVGPAIFAAFEVTAFASAAVPAALLTNANTSLGHDVDHLPAIDADVPLNGTASATDTESGGRLNGGSGAFGRYGQESEVDENGGKAPIAGADEIAEEMMRAAADREATERVAAEQAAAEAAAAQAAERLAAEAAAASATKEQASAAPGKSPLSGPRVLGRIDLKKQAKPVMPAQPAGSTDASGAAEKPAAEGEAAGKPARKKRRKVVQKEDLFDAMERSFQARPRKKRAAPGQKIKKTEVTMPKASKRVVRINDITSAGELAKLMSVKSGEVLGALMRLGVMKSINDALDMDTVTLVAEEFGYTVENTAVNVEALLGGDRVMHNDEGDGAVTRPPVVTVMGHVDHGKTSVLDVIRKTNVVSGEAGGITQHIGAYNVHTPHGDICFLDTPGHAAFTAMRARGATVTDIVVLVVAADDGVMPQTLEAISHAQAAGNPIIVAINKCDKPDANPDRVKQQLAERGLQTEDWGGQTQSVNVSAIQKTGIDDLLEQISVLAQLLELTAVKDKKAGGVVVEARLDRGRGPVATILVQEGTLKRGDQFVCGDTTGKIRAMTDYAGKPLEQAGPSTPVEITGLEGVPAAGDGFVVVDDAARAQQVAEFRRESTRKTQLASSTRMSLEDLQQQVASGEVEELKIIIKTDVHGTAEALTQALEKLSTNEVSTTVIHTGVGAINESDVQLALASNAMIIGFHVRPEAKARALAEREGAEVRLHTVIYEAVDEVKAALEGLLRPDFKEKILGHAEVRDTFNVPGGLTIGGSYVLDGTLTRNGDCRLLRDNVVITTSKINSLRRFKDDVREVQTGYECGIGIEKFNDLKLGDVIECFKLEAVKRTFEQSVARTAQQDAAQTD